MTDQERPYRSLPTIDPENTWVISDTHWGHDNIVGFCDRPENHEDIMVAHWQATVPPEATVLHLGDLSYRNNAYFRSVIAPKLPGEKLLVKGNHDKQRGAFYKTAEFKVIKPFKIDYKGSVVSFDHYPKDFPLPKYRLHVHGHIHNNGYGGKDGPFIPFRQNQINVSVEMIHYRPVNLARLLDGALGICEWPENSPKVVKFERTHNAAEA